MKKSLLLSLLLIGSTSAMAAKVGDKSVGIELGMSNTKSTAKTTNLNTGVSFSTTDTTKATYEAVKLGQYFEFGRVGVALGHINKKDDVSTNYVSAIYDYMLYNDSKFTPYIGGLVSYSDGTNNYSSFDFHETGFSYGAEIGLLYEISKSFDLEIGVRYLGSNVSGDDTVQNIKVNVDVDNITQYNFGLNYNF